jgi:stalled ribosome rescue protein Dom34
MVGLVAPKIGYKRGYAVAILIGLTENSAVVWRVYSHVVKPETTVQLGGSRNNPKAIYNFHEAIVNALRGILREGVRSIILVSPPRTTYATEYVDHVRKHQAWLTQSAGHATFMQMSGSALTHSDVIGLAKNPIFHKLIQDATSQESENLLSLLEKRLAGADGRDVVLYPIEEVEDAIYVSRSDVCPEFLLLTDDYLAKSRHKGRINRLMQIAANKKIKTRVVDSKSHVGKRLSQLGGIVCLAKKGQPTTST